MIEYLTLLVANLGFPIVVSLYLLVRAIFLSLRVTSFFKGALYSRPQV